MEPFLDFIQSYPDLACSVLEDKTSETSDASEGSFDQQGLDD